MIDLKMAEKRLQEAKEAEEIALADAANNLIEYQGLSMEMAVVSVTHRGWWRDPLAEAALIERLKKSLEESTVSLAGWDE